MAECDSAMTETTIRVMSDLIEPHLRHLRSRGFSEKTIGDRRKVLRRLDAELPLGIEEALVSELEEWLAKFTTNQTKATFYGHIVGFYRWACDDDDPYLDANPAASLRRPKVSPGVPNPVTDEELDNILGQVVEPFRTWLTLAAYAGLRPVEIAHLERQDVTEDTLTVRNGKGGKNAILPTHPLIWAVVKDLPPGRIAIHQGRTVEAIDISRSVGQYLRKLGVYGVGCRRLRHWFATTALNQCDNLRLVQELMRHASPATTAVYTLITDGQRRSAVRALPVLGAPASP
jgi:integrase